jgi:hypothetical protein
MSDLLLPVTNDELAQNEILTDQGYVAICGSVTGWYVPAVFNCLYFESLAHFLNSLATQKLGINPNKDNIKFFHFAVDDFIESSISNNAITLLGPRVQKTPNSPGKIAQMALSYLKNNQEIDGHIPFIIDALTGKKKEIDWTRNAFILFALAQYHNIIGDKESINILIPAYSYLKKVAWGQQDFIAYLYLARTAYLLDDKETQIQYETYVTTHYKDHINDPLVALQIGLFFLTNIPLQKKYITESEDIADAIFFKLSKLIISHVLRFSSTS